VQKALAASVPVPSRLGTPASCGNLIAPIVENDVFNGKVIRLEGDAAGAEVRHSGWRRRSLT
jgi:hypothetical protein